MVDDVYVNFHSNRYRRLASVATTSLCLLCCMPQPGFCIDLPCPNSKEFVHLLLNHVADNNTDLLVERFDELEGALGVSSNPLKEGREFLQLFIEEINIKYGVNLTMQSACMLVRENLHVLQLSEEVKNIISTTIELFTSNPIQVDHSLPNEENQTLERMTDQLTSCSLSWPWEWNWLGLNKKHHKHGNLIQANSILFPLLQAKPSAMEVEIPGEIAAGGAEMLAGALICVLGLVFPPAFGIGGALIIDGIRRGVNGALEMDKERHQDPNYTPPPNPFGVDF